MSETANNIRKQDAKHIEAVWNRWAVGHKKKAGEKAMNLCGTQGAEHNDKKAMIQRTRRTKGAKRIATVARKIAKIKTKGVRRIVTKSRPKGARRIDVMSKAKTKATTRIATASGRRAAVRSKETAGKVTEA